MKLPHKKSATKTDYTAQ